MYPAGTHERSSAAVRRGGAERSGRLSARLPERRTMSMIERRISMEKTIENMDRNRLGILIRCLVILLITGVTNSAAVFVSPLAAHFNWTADAIAKDADFFCFGTNDLTQMTFGFSRDDAGKFLNAYYDTKIFENDPFAKLDQTGVGKLMEMAIKLGKPVNPKLHVGICGEHGGDPSSVEFCHKIGLDYVSCSPFRVPIARLAAAQAAIADK